jgi:hypothetical protein
MADRLRWFSGLFGTVEDVEVAKDFLKEAINSSCENKCSLWTTGASVRFRGGAHGCGDSVAIPEN